MKSVTLFLCVLGVALANNAALKELVKGNQAFTANFHKKLLNEDLKNNGNLIASSMSAQTILALTQLGAKGNTASELAAGLKLPSTTEKTIDAFNTLLLQLEDNDNVNLAIANKIFIKKGFSIKPEYNAIANHVFQSEIQSIDFSNQENAADTINFWVDQKTNNKITNVVNSKQFTPETALVLINAIYFKAKWAKQFNSSDTYVNTFFTLAKNEVKVPVMHTINYFNYNESKKLNAKFLELYYQGGEFKMTIVLPNEKQGLVALENQLVDVFAPREYTEKLIELSLPKFSILSELNLVEVLKNLGIKKVFTFESDLSGIADTRDLCVTDVIQKAFINVTEVGTEAAAATVVEINVISGPSLPIKFNVDHPFLFTVSHKSGEILFNGRVNLPKI